MIKDNELHTSAKIYIKAEKKKLQDIILQFANERLPYEVKNKGFSISKVKSIDLTTKSTSVLFEVEFETIGNLVGGHRISFEIKKTVINDASADAVIGIVPGSISLQVRGWYHGYVVPIPGQFEWLQREADLKEIKNTF